MRAQAFGFLALLACDPVRSVQGRVLSQAEAGEASGLPGADVTLVCEESRYPLAKTGSDGGFSYVSIGYWPERCALEASTFDASHRQASRSIAELCRASAGRADCLRIENANLTLARLSAERRRARVSFRPDDARMELWQRLGESEERLCSGACETEVLAGEHRLSVRLREGSRELWAEDATISGDRELRAHFVEDTDPTWPSVLGTAFVAAGAGLLLYASWKEDSVPAIAGASAIGVGLTLSLVWLPGMHAAEVRWQPAAAEPN